MLFANPSKVTEEALDGNYYELLKKINKSRFVKIYCCEKTTGLTTKKKQKTKNKTNKPSFSHVTFIERKIPY